MSKRRVVATDGESKFETKVDSMPSKVGVLRQRSVHDVQDPQQLASELKATLLDPGRIAEHVDPIETLKHTEAEGVWGVSMHPDGRSFVYGTDKKRLVFVAYPSMEVLHTAEAAHPAHIRYSPTGDSIVFADWTSWGMLPTSGKIQQMDTRTYKVTGEVVRKAGGGEEVRCGAACYDPTDGNRIATFALMTEGSDALSLVEVAADTFEVARAMRVPDAASGWTALFVRRLSTPDFSPPPPDAEIRTRSRHGSAAARPVAQSL